jgi:hypothetical protein
MPTRTMNAVAKFEIDLGGIERAHLDIVENAAAQSANDPARSDTIGVFGEYTAAAT